MKYQIKTLLIGAMAALSLGSCSEQEPDVFQNINGVYLNNRSNTNILQANTNVTFVYQKGDEMQVPVKIQLVGRPTDQPREIALMVSSEDAQEGTDYILPEKAEMPAGETVLEYMITLKRTAILKTQEKHIQVSLQPNENFTLPVTEETTANGDVVSTLLIRLSSLTSLPRHQRHGKPICSAISPSRSSNWLARYSTWTQPISTTILR